MNIKHEKTNEDGFEWQNTEWQNTEWQESDILNILKYSFPVKLSWISYDEDYQVFNDAGENYILVGIWKKYPIKCKEFKPGISWWVYTIKDNRRRIWFSVNGFIKTQVFLNKNNRIIDIDEQKYYDNPTLIENTEEKKDEKQQVETSETLSSPLPIELSWINTNKNYKVFHSSGEKFILVDIWKEYPIKCKEYKPEISWLVYSIENNTYKIWFSTNGHIKERVSLNEYNRIIDVDTERFYKDPILYEDPEDELWEIELDPDATYMRGPRWNPYEDKDFDPDEFDKKYENDPY